MTAPGVCNGTIRESARWDLGAAHRLVAGISAVAPTTVAVLVTLLAQRAACDSDGAACDSDASDCTWGFEFLAAITVGAIASS